VDVEEVIKEESEVTENDVENVIENVEKTVEDAEETGVETETVIEIKITRCDDLNVIYP
jgi:transcriptional regulator NrdR family protein